MNATIRGTFLRAGVAAIACLAAASSYASTFTVADSEGFETYTTTAIEGQFAKTDGGFGLQQWVQSPLAGTGTAVVQTSVVASGSQALEVNRAANSDDRWAVPVVGYPAERYICIEWDMLVEQTVSNAFGPFFGIEAYDDDATSIIRMGMLGVDASTGEVLYGDSAVGLIPTPGGETVAFDEWYSYRMILDFATDTYYGFVDDALVVTTAFEFPGADQFTDADIAALAASGDPTSLALTGTAYFDNYLVIETDAFDKIPEPASALLAGLALAAVVARRRV